MSEAGRYPGWLALVTGLSIAAAMVFGLFVVWITAALSSPPVGQWAQIIAVWLVLPVFATVAATIAGKRLIERAHPAAGKAVSLAPLAVFALMAGWLWLR